MPRLPSVLGSSSPSVSLSAASSPSLPASPSEPSFDIPSGSDILAAATSRAAGDGSNSPLFPSAKFTSESIINSPENQLTSTGGITISIVLAEPVLFLQGFTEQEYVDTAPAMLRGSLIITTSKPTKIKGITLTFKGQSRTEWPEGIPPKRVETHESKDIHCHVWSFFNSSFPMAEFSSGAHLVRYAKDSSFKASVASPAASPHRNRPRSSSNEVRGREGSPNGSVRGRSALSLAPTSSSSSIMSNSSPGGIKGLASMLRRAASPAPSTSQLSAEGLNGVALGPHRSFSKNEAHDQDANSKGYRVFEPGEYIYNFELPIPQSLPESIKATFGSVKYTLDAVVERPGTFKSNVSGTRDVVIVRAASDSNLESSEPIAISRDWEDQLHYDIIIGGKSFPIGTQIPIAFKFTPLAKMRCHRIRVYITENMEYFCKNNKVHRIEPTKKYLLKEYLPDEGLSGSLLGEYHGAELAMATEMEYYIDIPMSFSNGREKLHANTGYSIIQVNHWIKIVLRMSKVDPEDDSKRKYYEISIDSPISLLDNHCTNANLLLPQYNARRPSLMTVGSSTAIPMPMPSSSSHSSSSSDENFVARPIHFLRQPSIAPPPFDADQPPPSLERVDNPPSYETAVSQVPSNEEPSSSRFDSYVFGAAPRSSRVPSVGSSSLQSSETSGEASSSDVSSLSATSSATSTSTTVGTSSEHFTAQRINRQVSMVSSIDIVDQSLELDDADPLDSRATSTTIPGPSQTVPTQSKNKDKDIPRQSRPMEPSQEPSERSLSASSSIFYDRPANLRRSSSASMLSTIRSTAYPGESLPLLGHRPSLKGPSSEYGGMDPSGDLGLTVSGDFDDAASLQSTPSLWIS